MDAFNTLNAVDVNGHTEKKNGLTYLSWAWAWAEVKKRYPESYYTVYENAAGLNYHTDGKTAWVKTGVTLIDGEKALEHIEYLPVMDMRNKSIPVGNMTSFDVNKAIQRSLTKACARHGLGLYIYAGEDLPEGEEAEKKVPPTPLPRKITESPSPVTVEKTATVYSPKEQINAIKRKYGVDDEGFKRIRQTLILGGCIEDIPSSKMTEADWQQLFRAIEVNFPLDEAGGAT